MTNWKQLDTEVDRSDRSQHKSQTQSHETKILYDWL